MRVVQSFTREPANMRHFDRLNSDNFGNFKDSDGQKAVPYLLVFETKK